ncbi:MAG: hypothetical protein E7672_07060, partial [Ruminococcaceae bacterium]|nr:hypothetical protein [Oscillospiraceae bacterium]
MNTQQKKGGKKLSRFLVAAAILFVLARIALNDSLDVKEYSIESGLVEGEHRFVLLSDLHSTMYGESQRGLIEKIEKYSPEAIFMVGDIGDNKREFDGTAILLEELSGYDMYYVTGNHERWVDYTDDIKMLFEDYGVVALSEGMSVELGDGIRLFGIDDPLFYKDQEGFYSDLENAGVSDEVFDILLSHRPEYAERYAREE